MAYVVQVIWILSLVPLCFGSKLNFEKNKRLFMILSFGFCVLIMGFRNITVGVDNQTYSLYYSYIINYSWIDIFANYNTFGIELGWRIAYKLCSYLSENYYTFQVIYAVIYISLYGNFLSKTVPNTLSSIALFLGVGLFTGAFNVQRQFFAVAILANGFLYFREKKWIQTIVCLFLATLAHTTSVIFIVVLVIYQLRNSKWILRIIPPVIILLAVNYSSLIKFAKTLFPAYRNYYVNQMTVQTAGGVWIIWIFIIVMSIYTLYLRKTTDNEYRINCIFAISYVVCNIVGLYFNYFERLGLFFVPFLPAFFYGFGKQISRSRYRQMYNIGLIFSFFTYYLLGCFTGKALEYSTFLFK